MRLQVFHPGHDDLYRLGPGIPNREGIDRTGAGVDLSEVSGTVGKSITECEPFDLNEIAIQ